MAKRDTKGKRRVRAYVNLVGAVLASLLVLDLCLVGQIPKTPPLGVTFDPATGVWRMVAGAATVHNERIHSPFVERGASIRFNATGIPTITAQQTSDAMFAEGYATARFRLLQLDLERRLGEGQLSAVVGKAGLASDELQLTLGLTRTAQAEWHALPAHSELRTMLESYAGGINRAIADMEATNTLPTAMRLLDYRPAPWSPIDTLVIEGDLNYDLDYTTSPADMALLEQSLGAKRTAAWFPVTPSTPQAPYDLGPYKKDSLAPIPALIPGTSPTPGVASVTASTASLSTKNQSRVVETLSSPQQGVAATLMKWLATTSAQIHQYGASNNWAVAPSRTASGQTILENDPHLVQTLPSIWYQVVVHTPQIQLSGVEVPGIPGILLGRSQHVAWGMTDTQNQATLLYRERVSQNNSHFYWWKGQWHTFRTVRYMIHVAGGTTIPYTVKISVHGPQLKLPGGTFSVWWAGAMPNHDLAAITGLWTAKNTTQVRTALRNWGAANMNVVYADDQGNIGIAANGIYPQVAHGTPWLPLSGTGADDVIGTIPASQIPHVDNPSQGFVVSANERPVTSAYPYYIGTVYDFFDPGYRALTISAALAKNSSVTSRDVASLQTSVSDHLAVNLLPLLVRVVSAAHRQDATDRVALRALQNWNGDMTATSAAAALYYTWLNHYAHDVFGPWWTAMKVPVAKDSYLKITPTTNAAMAEDLQSWTLQSQTGLPPRTSAFALPSGRVRTPASVMVQAFDESVAALSKKLGSVARWQWSSLQSRQFASLTGAPALGYGPRGSGGDAFTPNAADGFPVANQGPSWREIIALGKPRKGTTAQPSLGVYPGGQSENPLSSWYETWVTTWWNGQLVPLSDPLTMPPHGVTWTVVK